MWIKYIQLKNFQNFKTGLKANEIEIDFSKRENVICLLVGPNGIGKTSFLSCLTPFATLGNLDIRDANQLVIKGKNGYKKIIIMDGKTEYVIQHIYTASKETHTVKSYIARDGVELNPNGNVTSFKSLVSEYLSIDMDYLKLIRLGDNVTNLIKLKTTDRKNFMSKFLDSVDVYLKYYQKMTSDVKDLKLLISHTVDKLNHLNIEDITVAKEEVDTLKEAISIKEKDSEECLRMIGNIESKILSLSDQDFTNIPLLKKKIDKFNKALKNNEYKDTDSFFISNMKDELEKEVVQLSGVLSGLKIEKSSISKMIGDLLDEKESLSYALDTEKKNSNIASLNEYYDELIKKRDTLIENLPKVSYKDLTKQNVDAFVVMLKNVQHTLNTTYEFGEQPVKEAVDILRKDKNISKIIASKLVGIEKTTNTTQKTYLDKIIDKYKNVKVPECEGCPLVHMYNDIMVVKDIKVDTKKKEEHSVEFWEMVNAIYDNLSFVLSELKGYSEIIKLLPEKIQSFFVLNTLYTNIEKCRMIYDDKLINELLSNITELDNYNKLLIEIMNVERELDKEMKISKIPYLEASISKTSEKLENMKFDFDEKNERVLEIEETINNLQTNIEELTDLYDAKMVGEKMENELEELLSSKEKYNSYNKDLSEMQEKNRNINKDITLLRDHLKTKEIQIEQYQSLSKELVKTRNMYDELVLIKASTSTKEGIPLFYIQLYLDDIKELANTLLDIVYDGEIYIQNFEISSTEFKIPFVKNGIEIPDISFASQGEQSFLSMAISFALSSKNLEDYNIPLLDEVDSTFDSNNRERFLSIIEHQNSIIHCEQEFVISHNNMFSQYPVDVIDFSNLKASKFDIKIH